MLLDVLGEIMFITLEYSSLSLWVIASCDQEFCWDFTVISLNNFASESELSFQNLMSNCWYIVVIHTYFFCKMFVYHIQHSYIQYLSYIAMEAYF